MTAADDVNLDDLKRRARRRLVGAVVLALVVAVVVPMLLENEPKPLGEDVAVRIPPVDDGKFVNRLSDKGKADSAKPDAAKSGKAGSKGDAGAKGDAGTDPRSDVKGDASRPEPNADAESVARASDAGKGDGAGAATAPKADPGAPANSGGARSDTARSEPAKEPASAPAKTDASKAELSSATQAASIAASSAATAATATKAAPNGAAGIPAAAPNGLFAVQVYAFSDAYGANSLVNKLKRVGYPAYSEPTTTSKGQLWRVRIGPFASREVAATARDKLKGEGYNGIVTTR